MYVRLVSLAREKAELLGSKKMMPRFSEEIFVVDKVNKHTRRATGNVTYTYKLRRTNGQNGHMSNMGTPKRRGIHISISGSV